MKVYVVTEGEYSDYSVEAVFSTRELAEAYEVKLGALREGRGSLSVGIDEWEVDQYASMVVKTVFRCRLRLEDGAVIQEWQYWTLAEPNARCEDAERVHSPCDHVMAASYVSPAHSLKLAAEERQKWLREIGGAIPPEAGR